MCSLFIILEVLLILLHHKDFQSINTIFNNSCLISILILSGFRLPALSASINDIYFTSFYICPISCKWFWLIFFGLIFCCYNLYQSGLSSINKWPVSFAFVLYPLYHVFQFCFLFGTVLFVSICYSERRFLC